jgi:hypothetical protein
VPAWASVGVQDNWPVAGLIDDPAGAPLNELKRPDSSASSSTNTASIKLASYLKFGVNGACRVSARRGECPMTTRTEKRQTVLKHVKNLHLNKSFTPAQITEATGVWKGYVRDFLHDVAGIDQKLLNFGKPDGKVCRTGPIETGSRLA